MGKGLLGEYLNPVSPCPTFIRWRSPQSDRAVELVPYRLRPVSRSPPSQSNLFQSQGARGSPISDRFASQNSGGGVLFGTRVLRAYWVTMSRVFRSSLPISRLANDPMTGLVTRRRHAPADHVLQRVEELLVRAEGE